MHFKKLSKTILPIFYFFFILGNYLTLNTVNEFLISIQAQARFIKINDIPQTTSMNTPTIEFAGLCRLELKVEIFSMIEKYFIKNFIKGYE